MFVSYADLTIASQTSDSEYLLNAEVYLAPTVETKKVILKMDIEIDIPKDIMSDKKRLKKVQEGILKVISKGP